MGGAPVTYVHSAAILIATYLGIFLEACPGGLRPWIGAQVDILPALIVYCALNTGLMTLTATAVLGGLWFDTLSSNPLGISVLPQFLVGMAIFRTRELILRDQPYARLLLGTAASAAAPFLTLLLLLGGGYRPIIGWGSLWQWVVLAVGGGLLTPVFFWLFDRINGALAYSRPLKPLFDRIGRSNGDGPKNMLIFDQIKKGDAQLRGIALTVALGLGVLLTGLWYVQVVSAQRYRADLQEQSLRIVRVPAIRGKILDRNGHALVENRPSYNVNLYMEEFRRYFRYEYTNRVLKDFRREHPNVRPTRKVDEALQAAARARVVSNLVLQVSALVARPQILDEKQFNNHYDNLRSLPFPVMRDLSPNEMAMFIERSTRLPSLALEVQPVRTYPWTYTAAHLLGHLKRENNPDDDEEISFQFRLPDYTGVMGIELAFDQELRGHPGVKSVLVNNLQYRQAEEILTPPRPGQNVILTLDLTLQRAAEQALRNVGPDTRGAAVLMDCQTGDVLAMASAPSFDPNMFTARISEEEWAKLSDSELRPQLNRAAYGTYPPGSIFKIIVALACLEAGTLKTNDVFHSQGRYQIEGKGHTWRDTAGAGDFEFERAFYRSSNPYFIDFGLKVGFERLAQMGRQFGLGQRTGLATRQEAAGYYPDPSDKIKKDGSRWMAGDTANLCIGQGELLVTPLQMAVMTAAIANGGRVLEPRLVDRIEPQEPGQTEGIVHFPLGQVRSKLQLDPKNLQIVQHAMLLDVTHRDERGRLDGTGVQAAVEGMQVCGKTGTAQLMKGRELKEHIVWFTSFAPFEAPRYALVVVIEGGDSGGGTCAPVARDIYQAILNREQHPPAKGPGALAAN